MARVSWLARLFGRGGLINRRRPCCPCPPASEAAAEPSVAGYAGHPCPARGRACSRPSRWLGRARARPTAQPSPSGSLTKLPGLVSLNPPRPRSRGSPWLRLQGRPL
jgi:hypothetical protein